MASHIVDIPTDCNEETRPLIRRSRSMSTDSSVNDSMTLNSFPQRRSTPPSSSEPCQLSLLTIIFMFMSMPFILVGWLYWILGGTQSYPVDRTYIHNFAVKAFYVSSFQSSATELRGDWFINFDITNWSFDSNLSYEDQNVSISQNGTTLWTTKMPPFNQKAGEKTGVQAIFTRGAARDYDLGVWNAIATNWTSGNSIYLTVQISSNVLEQGLSSDKKDTTWSSRYRIEISCMIVLDFDSMVKDRLLSSKYNACKAERKSL